MSRAWRGDSCLWVGLPRDGTAEERRVEAEYDYQHVEYNEGRRADTDCKSISGERSDNE